jgi:phosphatidylserine decarboxylase
MPAASLRHQAHQYVDRDSGRLKTERLYQDRLVLYFYGRVRESMPAVFRMLTSRTSTRLLGYLNYDTRWGSGAGRRFLRDQRIDLDECLDDPAGFQSVRQVFERRIRYWDCRPMPEDSYAVVSPADARVLVGSFREQPAVCIKEKFFDFAELLGRDRHAWLAVFADGDYAVCRLTPEKYHYNHSPVAGVVVDHYQVDGHYHSCNPGAAVAIATPYSKNRRVVTVIDTDAPGGTHVGKVAMVEVVALMIGDIVQCASRERYDDPRPVVPGMFLKRGGPKSLFRPGSSTTLLVFEKDRVRFASDLIANQAHAQAHSRYTAGFGQPLIETDVRVRSLIAHAVTGARRSGTLLEDNYVE